MKTSQCFCERHNFLVTCEMFQSILIRSRPHEILRAVIKSSCLFQLQTLGPCTSCLEVHQHGHTSWGSVQGEEGSVFSLSPSSRPTGEACRVHTRTVISPSVCGKLLIRHWPKMRMGQRETDGPGAEEQMLD